MMTENKRFTLHKGLDTLNIMDNTKFNEHIYINKSSKDMELLVGVLNELHEENEQLKRKNKGLQSELHIFKEDITHSNKIIDKLNGENEQLKKDLKIIEEHRKQETEYTARLEEENEQLQERNNRQAKQLDRLYRLIEEKDWRTLNDILDDFKRCEEQLQREWGTYSV